MPVESVELIDSDDVFPYLITQIDDDVSVTRIDRVFSSVSRRIKKPGIASYEYVRSSDIQSGAIGRLWDRVALTALEDEVAEALRIIDNDVDRVTLVGDSNSFGERVPFVKLRGLSSPIPLKSLGDGINRVFLIALSLVNSRDGLFLCDEIENGLHYSVLSDVWRLIFQTALRLNVQVFATTHSWECIQAFQKAAEEDQQSEGTLIRLRNKSGDVVATMLDEEDLAVVTRDGLEVR